MQPSQNLREIVGIVSSEKKDFELLTSYFAKGFCKAEAEEKVAWDKKFVKYAGNSVMVKIPGKDYEMLSTEVTQKTYETVMGENPSEFKGDDLPVENVSWYDAIYFCNKLSEKIDLTPFYAVDGKTDVSEWKYTPHNGNSIRGKITQNKNADGFCLPTKEEWQYAAKGGEDYEYSGSDNLDEVGWYSGNSGYKTHPVAEKKANRYGLYDMSGNVWEWVWGSDYIKRYYCGGSWNNRGSSCNYSGAGYRDYNIGFRLIRRVSK
ncbi:MAG: formylglycine-generating enzyme family protein [Treponema sp.]|nr:formylglycine-generating enzyme family protein [Treponema sp.]